MPILTESIENVWQTSIFSCYCQTNPDYHFAFTKSIKKKIEKCCQCIENYNNKFQIFLLPGTGQ